MIITFTVKIEENCKVYSNVEKLEKTIETFRLGIIEKLELLEGDVEISYFEA